MNTEDEMKENRKHRAKKILSSSDSEEEHCRYINVPSPPFPPAKVAKNEQHRYVHDNATTSDVCSKKIISRNIRKNYDRQLPKIYEDSRSLSQDAYNCSSHGREEEVDKNVTDRLNQEDTSRSIIYTNISQEVDLFHRDRENIGKKEIILHNDNLNHQSSQATIVDYLKQLSREMTIIKYDVKHALALLDILVKRDEKEKKAQNPRCSFEKVEKFFPLKTQSQITDVENILKGNSQDTETIRAYVRSISRINIDDAVKRTLYKIFSNSLAEKYNWEGRRGKESLHNLEIMKIIFRSVLQNVVDSDQRRIQRRVMEWFRHSKARKQNEEKRCATLHGEINIRRD